RLPPRAAGHHVRRAADRPRPLRHPRDQGDDPRQSRRWGRDHDLLAPAFARGGSVHRRAGAEQGQAGAARQHGGASPPGQRRWAARVARGTVLPPHRRPACRGDPDCPRRGLAVNRALWLLMKLRLKGWGRRLVKQVQTVRGAILASIFGMMLLMWIGSLLINAIIIPRAPGSTAPPEQVERFAPFVLLLYCVGVLVGSGNQSPLQFTLPEVQFLFSGPFSRRQVLTYKLLSQLMLTLPLSVFISLALRNVAGMYLAGLVTAVLVFSFLQLYATAVAMVASALGDWSYTRARR